MKTYRYTIVAYEEIDIKAETREEADKKAQEEWDSRFRGMFGDPEYEGIIEEVIIEKLNKRLKESIMEALNRRPIEVMELMKEEELKTTLSIVLPTKDKNSPLLEKINLYDYPKLIEWILTGKSLEEFCEENRR